MNRLEEFLKELSELTKKYELKIGGCGCCGSPWIVDLNGRGCCGDGLRYKSEEQKYFVCVVEDDDE